MINKKEKRGIIKQESQDKSLESEVSEPKVLARACFNASCLTNASRWLMALLLVFVTSLSGVMTVEAQTASTHEEQTPGAKDGVRRPSSTQQQQRTERTEAVGTTPGFATKSAALITEFEVNGLKVLVKRRARSQTVAAGLFMRGGARNITADNAGIEALMLAVATDASANFPRERLRTELARLGTGIGSGSNYDSGP